MKSANNSPDTQIRHKTTTGSRRYDSLCRVSLRSSHYTLKVKEYLCLDSKKNKKMTTDKPNIYSSTNAKTFVPFIRERDRMGHLISNVTIIS